MDGSFHRTAGRGFLWGPLADGASKALNVAEKMYSKGNIPRAGSVASVAGMNVEMPSLSSTSDLPSGVIPGIRKALMWTDEEGGWTSPTIFSRYALKNLMHLITFDGEDGFCKNVDTNSPAM